MNSYSKSEYIRTRVTDRRAFKISNAFLMSFMSENGCAYLALAISLEEIGCFFDFSIRFCAHPLRGDGKCLVIVHSRFFILTYCFHDWQGDFYEAWNEITVVIEFHKDGQCFLYCLWVQKSCDHLDSFFEY